jgi:hypothetical protein
MMLVGKVLRRVLHEGENGKCKKTDFSTARKEGAM